MIGIGPESLTLVSPEERKGHFFAEFIGVPASRKTTLVRSLGAQLGFATQQEIDVVSLPIFKDYYQDPKTHALSFQKMVFERSLEQVLGSEEEPGVIKTLQLKPLLREPTIWEHPLYARASLSPEQLDQYRAFVVEKLNGRPIPRPDILFYNYMDPDYMIEAIRLRAEKDPLRTAELSAPVEYWMRLWHIIDNWVYTNPLNLEIVRVPMRSFDYKLFPSREACDGALTSMLNGWVDYNSAKRVLQ